MGRKQAQKDTLDKAHTQKIQRTLPLQQDLLPFEMISNKDPNQYYEQRHEPPFHDPIIEDTSDGEIFGDSPDLATSELGGHLLFSAHAIEKSNQALKTHASALRNAIANRLASEARLTAQSLRLAIGTIWLMIAFLLYMNVSQRGKSGIFSNGLGSQMPVEHASGLSTLFLIAALPVIILAIISVIYIWHATGNNSRIRSAAENLGLHIASAAHDYDNALNNFLKNNGREKSLSDTAQDLSRAHLTALEVQLFFRRLKFMNAKTRNQAIADLQGFLKGSSPAPLSPFIAAFVGIIIGVISTNIFMSITGDTPTQTTTAVTMPDIFRYPTYLMTLLIGAVLFLFAGAICDVLTPNFGGVRRKALDDALDALRGAYTGDNAPRFHEIIRRIEEAMAAYQARINDLKSTNTKNQTALAQHHANKTNSHHDADLEWRHRDSNARFVDTGFQAIPNPFKGESHQSDQSRQISRYKSQTNPKKP